MKWLERAAFLAVFVTLGKFCENHVGTWAAVAVTLAIVFVPVGLYALVQKRGAR